MEALKQKARRGELFFTVAVGYVKACRDRIERDPDLRMREAIGLVFSRFAEMQSTRQVFLSLCADRIELPYVNHARWAMTTLWSSSVCACKIPPSPLRAHYVRATVKVRRYQDGSHAIFHGPRCIGRYDESGTPLDTPIPQAA